MTPPDRDQAPRAKGVVAWERPTLTLLGDPASPRKGRLIG